LGDASEEEKGQTKMYQTSEDVILAAEKPTAYK